MARRRPSEAQRQERARVGALRSIARGDRPLYRVRIAQDGSWDVDWCPWLVGTAANRRVALAEARATIAEWLEVDPEAFEVERA
jgi:hypothetical protein